MELIQTVTLTSNATSIIFTDIPQDGIELVLRVSGLTDSNAATGAVQPNGTSSGYYWARLYSYGTGGFASNAGNNAIMPTSEFAQNIGSWGSQFVRILNYTSTASKKIINKGYATRYGSNSFFGIAAGYGSTGATTSLKFIAYQNKTMLAGTTASLYKLTQ